MRYTNSTRTKTFVRLDVREASEYQKKTVVDHYQECWVTGTVAFNLLTLISCGCRKAPSTQIVHHTSWTARKLDRAGAKERAASAEWQIRFCMNVRFVILPTPLPSIQSPERSSQRTRPLRVIYVLWIAFFIASNPQNFLSTILYALRAISISLSSAHGVIRSPVGECSINSWSVLCLRLLFVPVAVGFQNARWPLSIIIRHSLTVYVDNHP